MLATAALLPTANAQAVTPAHAPAITHSATPKTPLPPVNEVLRNLATGQCIDDSFAYGLRAISCNGLSYQVWAWTNFNGGYGRSPFQNQNTGRCMDDSFAYGLRHYDCNQSQYQTWVRTFV